MSAAPWMRSRRGVTPVVSSIIMCAVVLVIGTSVWGVASSASSIMQTDYFDEVMESVEKIKERFYVENTGFDNTSQPTLKIWVLNYGSYKINVTQILITGGGNHSYHYPPDDDPDNPPNGILIYPGSLLRFDVTPSGISLRSGLSITVRVESERENKAYDSIRIP